ncbi:MAG: hypothetical protein Kow00105_03140 [Phycisphaeraceae bacterium]
MVIQDEKLFTYRCHDMVDSPYITRRESRFGLSGSFGMVMGPLLTESERRPSGGTVESMGLLN